MQQEREISPIDIGGGGVRLPLKKKLSPKTLQVYTGITKEDLVESAELLTAWNSFYIPKMKLSKKRSWRGEEAAEMLAQR